LRGTIYAISNRGYHESYSSANAAVCTDGLKKYSEKTMVVPVIKNMIDYLLKYDRKKSEV